MGLSSEEKQMLIDLALEQDMRGLWLLGHAEHRHSPPILRPSLR